MTYAVEHFAISTSVFTIHASIALKKKVLLITSFKLRYTFIKFFFQIKLFPDALNLIVTIFFMWFSIQLNKCLFHTSTVRRSFCLRSSFLGMF